MPVSNELKAIIETAERFARRELAPRAIDLDNYPFVEFNRAGLDAARSAGLVAVNLPEAAGGPGLGLPALCEVLRALAREDASFAAIILADAFARSALVAAGKEAEAGRLAGGLIGGPLFDLPHEPQAGAVAEADGDGFKLSGRVEYVSLAPVAAALVVPAVLDGSPALFLVDIDTPGLEVGAPVVSLGLRGCPAADISLSACHLGPDRLLTRDAAQTLTTAALPYRAAVAAVAAGIADGSFRAARAYAESRYQAGKMIIEHDMVRQMLAGIAVVAETGAALFRSMAQAVEDRENLGQPPIFGDENRMAVPVFLLESGAVLTCEQAAMAATDGVQCLGGYGYMEDYGQEKRMRDAKQVQGIFGPAPLRRLRMLA